MYGRLFGHFEQFSAICRGLRPNDIAVCVCGHMHACTCVSMYVGTWLVGRVEEGINGRGPKRGLLFVGCLMSQQRASVSTKRKRGIGGDRRIYRLTDM